MSTTTLTKTVAAKVATVLYEAEYETLNKMLSSRDPADHTMAQAVLNQCDVKTSIYWIWKLAKRHNTRMVYLRTKNSRIFRDECDLFPISRMKETEFALHLKSKDWLTEEIYQRLKPGILQELASRNANDNFYDIHITIKPHYQEFDPEHTLIQL